MFSDYPLSMTLTPAGDVVLAVSLGMSADFGGGPIVADIGVATLSADGAHIWSKGFETYNVRDVEVDAAGNIILTGMVLSQANFGGGTIISNGSYDIYVAKLDPNGNHIWSVSYGGSEWDEPAALDIDSAGNIVIAGTFGGSVSFGATVLSAADADDVYVAKLSGGDGSALWAKRFGGIGAQQAQGVASGPSDQIAVVGYFLTGIDFGGGVIPSEGDTDGYVVVMDGAGSPTFSRTLGGAQGSLLEAVAFDAAGQVLVAGEFSGDIDFGGATLTSNGGYDVAIARLDAAGNEVWSAHHGGVAYEIAASVQITPSGHIVLAGSYAGEVTFGGADLPMLPDGNYSVFIARFDGAGNHVWSNGYGGPDEQTSLEVRVDSAENTFLAGSYADTIDFGGGALPIAVNFDGFIVKFGP
jgi:hypothetical protein